MGPRTQDDQGMPLRHPSHARSTLLGVCPAHLLLPVALLGPLPCESRGLAVRGRDTSGKAPQTGQNGFQPSD